MQLYRVQVTLASNNRTDNYNFPRIPVVGDHLVIDTGMFKVIEVRMYYFADHHDNEKDYYGLCAHVIVTDPDRR